MTPSKQCGFWKLVAASCLAIAGSFAVGDGAFAQIVPDRTLPNNSAVTESGNNSAIEGGTSAGSNLFHSFESFSLPTGSSAYFNNAADVENIFSRVTGRSPSDIDGLIRANGRANLFLLNPNGIMFGRNASLNIGGSFVATTADAIGFGDRGVFSATNPSNPELLSVNPNALLFNQIRAASIVNSSVAPSGFNPSSVYTTTGLGVPNGKSLLLVGGDLDIDGGGLYAFGGRVELGGLASAGTIELNGNGNNPSLSFPDGVERSNVFLSNGAGVNVTAGDGGSIAVTARNFEMTGNSALYVGIASGLGNDLTQAGNIKVEATGAINLLSDSVIANLVESEARGQGGDVRIGASTLRLEGGAQLGTATLGGGKGGNLSVKADDVQLIGESADGFTTSGLFTTANRDLSGDAGDLTINTHTLRLEGGAQVGTATLGGGKGGNLSVKADDVQLIGKSANGRIASGLFTSTQRNSTGDAGDLTIDTDNLLVRDGATVNVQSLGTGTAGNMRLNARSIRLDNDAFLNANTRSAKVNPNFEQATININSQNLFMSRNSNIVTIARGENVTGGNINIDTDFLFATQNSDIRADSANFRGGNVRIDASGIFGTQFRAAPDDRTSDITATGANPQFSGTVELDVPDIDPNGGLVNLPSVPVDTQVARACTPSRGQNQSEFIVTGRGGLPPNPTEVLSSDAISIDWVALQPITENQSSPTPATKLTAPSSAPMVEATGWVIDRQGKVILTASNVPTQLHNSWQSSTQCNPL